MSAAKKFLKAREMSSFFFLLALFLIVGAINPKFLTGTNISACFNTSVVYTLVLGLGNYRYTKRLMPEGHISRKYFDMGKIKELGYAVKLDTNGSRPKIVKHLAEAGLIDKVAMDIKACPDNYGNLTGIEKPDMDSIFETADFLLHGNLDYEFRTTVVRELHTQKDFEEIAGWLAGAKEYYLQAYKDSDGVLRPGYGSYTFEELQNFQKILQKTILSVGIRGID